MTSTTTKTVPELLEAARDLINQNGWHRGSLYPGSRSYTGPGLGPAVPYRPGMPVCLYAACRIADTGNPWSDDAAGAIAALHATLERRYGRPYGLGSWQDSGHRTQQDVLQLIDDTLVFWHQQHAPVPAG